MASTLYVLTLQKVKNLTEKDEEENSVVVCLVHPDDRIHRLPVAIPRDTCAETFDFVAIRLADHFAVLPQGFVAVEEGSSSPLSRGVDVQTSPADLDVSVDVEEDMVVFIVTKIRNLILLIESCHVLV